MPRCSCWAIKGKITEAWVTLGSTRLLRSGPHHYLLKPRNLSLHRRPFSTELWEILTLLSHNKASHRKRRTTLLDTDPPSTQAQDAIHWILLSLFFIGARHHFSCSSACRDRHDGRCTLWKGELVAICEQCVFTFWPVRLFSRATALLPSTLLKTGSSITLSLYPKAVPIVDGLE